MGRLTRLVAIIAAVLAPAAAAQTPTSLLDRPSAERTVTVPGPPGHAERRRTIRCTTYPSFMVREIQEGDDIGSAGISVIPVTAGAPVACKATKSPGEKELPDNGSMSLVGAVGRFLLLIWPDGANGGNSFSVFDALAARKLYTDAVKGPQGFTRFSPASGGYALDLHYERVVNVPCSLAVGDASCWGSFARTAKLPAEIARRAPPTAACAAAYAKQNLRGRDLADPSVVSYPVVMTLAAAGGAKILSRGELSCWPSD